MKRSRRALAAAMAGGALLLSSCGGTSISSNSHDIITPTKHDIAIFVHHMHATGDFPGVSSSKILSWGMEVCRSAAGPNGTPMNSGGWWGPSPAVATQIENQMGGTGAVGQANFADILASEPELCVKGLAGDPNV